jgi:hypothetical protein
VENQEQVFHFPTAFSSLLKKKTKEDGRASPPARGGGVARLPLSSEVIVVDREK